MPDLMELFRSISLFAKLTMVVAIAAFGLAASHVFRPTDQKLTLMRPVSLAGIFATISGLFSDGSTCSQGLRRRLMGTCRFQMSIKALPNRSCSASCASASSPPHGCWWPSRRCGAAMSRLDRSEVSLAGCGRRTACRTLPLWATSAATRLPESLDKTFAMQSA